MSSTPTIHQRDNKFYYTDDGVEWELRVWEKKVVTVEISIDKNRTNKKIADMMSAAKASFPRLNPAFADDILCKDEDNTMPIAVGLSFPHAIQSDYDLEELHNLISYIGVEVEIKT